MKKLVFHTDRSMLSIQRELREDKLRIIRSFYRRDPETNGDIIIMYVVPMEHTT